MMTNTVGRLTAINSAYNWMNSANALSTLSFAGGNSQALNQQGTRFQLGMLNYGTSYKAGLLMDETARKLEHENIKRTFNVFA